MLQSCFFFSFALLPVTVVGNPQKEMSIYICMYMSVLCLLLCQINAIAFRNSYQYNLSRTFVILCIHCSFLLLLFFWLYPLLLPLICVQYQICCCCSLFLFAWSLLCLGEVGHVFTPHTRKNFTNTIDWDCAVRCSTHSFVEIFSSVFSRRVFIYDSHFTLLEVLLNVEHAGRVFILLRLLRIRHGHACI